MGLLGNIGNWLWNGAKSVASTVGIDTSGYENDEAQNWQADQAQIGRQWQENMLQKQMDYSTDMWNKTNEYNSAKNQANRWREAGLNPYMMMSGGNSGIAQVGGTPTGMSAPSAGQGHSNTHYTPAGQFMANIASAKASKALERKTNAEAGLMEAQSNLLTQKLQAEVSRMLKGNKLMDKYADQWFDTTFKLQKQQENTLASQEKLNLMDVAYQKLVNSNYPAEVKARIANLAADTGLKVQQEGLIIEQAQNEFYKGLSELERKENISLDNKTKRAIFESVVEQERVKADMYPYYYGPRDVFQATSGLGYRMDRSLNIK